MSFLRTPIAYVISYLLLMIPTYILPYFGSNSSIVNSLAMALGRGPTPQWWLHVWCLAVLILLNWLRGGLIQKGYLTVFPIIAAVFDLVPGLSLIPMIPTLLHLVGLILGVIGVAAASSETNIASNGTRLKIATIVAVCLSGIALLGSILFFTKSTNHAPNKVLDNPSSTLVSPAPTPAAGQQSAPQSVASKPKELHKLAPAKIAAQTPAQSKKPEVKEPPKVMYIKIND